MTTFLVPGHIQPWQRTTGGRHTPKATREFQAKVAMFAKSAGVKCIPAGTPVRLELTIIFPRPKKPTYPYPSQSDTSNTLKSVEDALNKVAYDDDRQITEGEQVKRFAMPTEDPGVWVTVKALGGQGPERATPDATE